MVSSQLLGVTALVLAFCPHSSGHNVPKLLIKTNVFFFLSFYNFCILCMNGLLKVRALRIG